MGCVILNSVGLVETVFPPIVFKRLHGKHDPICLANDPEFPQHKDAPLDEPATDDIDTPEVISPTNGGSVEEATTRDAPSISGSSRGEDRRPDPELPKTPPCPVIDDIFEKLRSGDEPLYVGDKWSGWPNTSKQSMGKELCEYMNKILATAREHLYGSGKGPNSGTEWVFCAEYATKNMKLDRVTRKPGIILIPSENTEAARWELVRSAGEVRSRHQSDRKLAEGRLAQYSRSIYGSDISRRFTLLFSLIRDEMVLFRYDRAGVLGSKRFNVHEDPKNFLRIIVGLGLGEDFFVGLDPSFSFKGPIHFVRLNDKEYEILEVLYLESVIRGRGTVVLRVRIDPETGKEGVIKDQWVDKAQHHQEIFWLLYLAAHGATNVATLEDHQLVRFKVGEDIVVDETSALRSLISGWDMDGIETREHRRVLVTPVGTPLKHFRSLKELVSVFKDFAEGILSIYRAKVYHRDISRHNLVIVRKEGEQIGKGYVIDFDCAAFVDNRGYAEVEPTGTVPFMAISILKENGCPHRFHYELESLFYTLIWTCLTADELRDDGCPKPTTEFCKTELAFWCGPKVVDPEDEEAVFIQIARTKQGLMVDHEEFKEKIISKLPPYFRPICGMLEKSRDFLFRPRLEEGIVVPPELLRVQDRNAEEAIQIFIDIFDEALKHLGPSRFENMSSASTHSNEQQSKDVAGNPELGDIAHRRMRQVQAQKVLIPPQVDLKDDGDNSSGGETICDLNSPTPLFMKGSRPLNPLVRSQSSTSSGLRTAVARTALTPISAFSKTAAPLEVVSSASSSLSGALRSGGGQSADSGSRDTDTICRKRAAECELCQVASKRHHR